MIEKEALISQLVRLKEENFWWGETQQDLYDHFEYELNHDEIIYLESNGIITGFVDWAWISCPEDVKKVNEGIKTDGEVLFLMNIFVKNREDFWKLKKQLPIHKYLAYQTRDNLDKVYAPKGWPKREVIPA